MSRTDPAAAHERLLVYLPADSIEVVIDQVHIREYTFAPYSFFDDEASVTAGRALSWQPVFG